MFDVVLVLVDVVMVEDVLEEVENEVLVLVDVVELVEGFVLDDAEVDQVVLVEVEELVVLLEAEVELEVVEVVFVMGMMKVMASAERCAP